MKKKLSFLAVLAFLSTTALAGTNSVVIKGVEYFKGLKPSHMENARYISPLVFDLPASYDAVAAGKATGIKGNGQGSCGDCWAWARTS